jgi:hypothetical protein
LFLLLVVGLPATAQTLDWSLSTEGALAAARVSGKPLLVYWVAGSGAPAFAQELDRMFGSWPVWTREVSTQVIPVRMRSWDSSLPLGLPALPGGGKISVLALGRPDAETWLASWTSIPAVLELSHALAGVGSLSLDEPYTLDVVSYELPASQDLPGSQSRTFVRVERGPYWTDTSDAGTKTWKEDGPVGALLVLRDTGSAVKVAFPLENDWSFLYNPVNQSWTPWSPVLVKHR